MYWGTAPLLCLILYWPGQDAWFHLDDFVWLNLYAEVRGINDLGAVLFQPMAQGTIRPLSERAFFLISYTLFGLNPWPFWGVVFATAFANLTLLASVGKKLTGSALAGLIAALLWLANDAVAVPLSWISAYNQMLVMLLILTAFYFLIRYVEYERGIDWYVQCVAFVLGFGALELNVIYPALATAYCLCCARKHLAKTLWLWAISGLYLVLRFAVAPTAGGVYTLYFDWDLLGTFAKYSAWVLGPPQFALIYPIPPWLRLVATIALGAALLSFVVVRRFDTRVPLFLVWWFVVALGPYLPLKLHIVTYYPMVAVIGLSILGAWALVWCCKRGGTARALSILAVLIYLAASIPVGRVFARQHHEYGVAARKFVEGVLQIHARHPEKTALLSGMAKDDFWQTFYHRPFRLFGISELYLAPQLNADPWLADPVGQSRVYPPELAVRAIRLGQAVVYDVGQQPFSNVTAEFYQTAVLQWPEGAPRRVEVAKRSFESQLGASWYPADGGCRWMSNSATIQMGGPRVGAEVLIVRGFAPAEQVADRPIEFLVGAQGFRLGSAIVDRAGQFQAEFAFPAELIGQESIEVRIDSSQTYRAEGDSRDLGACFSLFEIR
jgi:hypothetical protein